MRARSPPMALVVADALREGRVGLEHELPIAALSRSLDARGDEHRPRAATAMRATHEDLRELAAADRLSQEDEEAADLPAAHGDEVVLRLVLSGAEARHLRIQVHGRRFEAMLGEN